MAALTLEEVAVRPGFNNEGAASKNNNNNNPSILEHKVMISCTKVWSVKVLTENDAAVRWMRIQWNPDITNWQGARKTCLRPCFNNIVPEKRGKSLLYRVLADNYVLKIKIKKNYVAPSSTRLNRAVTTQIWTLKCKIRRFGSARISVSWLSTQFRCVMTFIRYVRRIFKFWLLDCVRYLGDFIIPRFVVSGFYPMLLWP